MPNGRHAGEGGVPPAASGALHGIAGHKKRPGEAIAGPPMKAGL